MMLMWWAVFFLSGCWISSRSITLPLMILLLMLYARRHRAPEERRRIIIFVLCASTSLVIWTSAQQRGRGCESGSLTGGPPAFAAAVRDRLIDSLEDPSLDERSGDLLSALLFGSREGLDRDLREAYAYLGIAHFLALSGLHLGILSIPLAWMLAQLPIGRISRAACMLLLLACYTILAGLPPSLVRATALATAFMFQRTIGRKTTLARSLALAILVIVLIDERILSSGGFQLSCAAVLAIALLGLPLIGMIRSLLSGRIVTRIVMIVLSPVVITVSVTIFTLPLQLLFFGRAPLLAPAYNLMVILPMTLLLYLGMVYTILPFGPLRAILAPPIDLTADLLWEMPMRLSTDPQPAILSGSLCWPLYLAGTCLLVYALRSGCVKRGQCLFASSALIIASLAVGGGRNAPDRSIGYDSSAGLRRLSRSAVLVSGELLVIEKGIGRREAEWMVGKLWKLGIGRVETIIICPARLGGRGGVEYIISRIVITGVKCSPYLAGYDTEFLEMLRARSIGVSLVGKDESIEVWGGTVRLFAPSFPPPEGGSITMESACIGYELVPREVGKEFEN